MSDRLLFYNTFNISMLGLSNWEYTLFYSPCKITEGI